ncbi:hypothetical protein Tco_0379405 [Tanacetum coccineum]
MIDYALWEVIENGATLPKITTVKGVVTEMPITTAEKKDQRRLEVLESASSKNQDNRTPPGTTSQEGSVPVETSTSIALVSCDGLGGYDWSLKSVEEKLEVYKANESIYSQDIKGLKFEIHIGEITIRELRKKLEIVQKEKDGIQLNVDKFEHAYKSLNKAHRQSDKFVNEPVLENSKAMSSKERHLKPKTEKKIVRPSIVKKEFVKSKQQEKTTRKTVKQVEQHRQNTHKRQSKKLEQYDVPKTRKQF